MERDELFSKFGFERVGGSIEGVFDAFTEADYEVDEWIWVDFKNKRVMLDPGDSGEPFLLKGDFTESEQEEYKKYEEAMEKSIMKSIGIESEVE